MPFGLARLIMPETAPRSFMQFRRRPCCRSTSSSGCPSATLPTTVAKVLSPAVRFTLDEIVELPPVIEREIQIEMGAAPDRRPTTMLQGARRCAAAGRAPSLPSTAAWCSASCCRPRIGWVYGDDGKTYELDNHNRINALLDIIEGDIDSLRPRARSSCSRRSSAPCRASVAALKKAKIDYATVSGDTPPAQRAEIFQAFQHTDKYQVLNAHPECMSHGLTLTAADTIVWFGPTTKLETFEQANARITRVGQTRKQQIIRLVASPVEKITYARLQAREDLQTSVLDLIADITSQEV